MDYHTAGEPFRIVTGGTIPIHGHTMLEKRQFAEERLDHVRRFLINEPRGHPDMYGCFVTEPVDEAADIGAVFFHNDGYSTACGHGTIALATWAIESGLVPISGPETRLTIDVPSGRLPVRCSVVDDRVRSVRFRNVPAFVLETNVALTTSAGVISVDIAYGGAFYACLDARSFGIRTTREHLPELITLGREIKDRLNASRDIVNPEDPDLRGIYGVIFFEPADGELIQRNVTVFADGEVDRSPCGSGTSARLALLAQSGEIAIGQTFVHRGIVGTSFRAWVVGTGTVGGLPAVDTEIEGSAALTGIHHFILAPDDEVGLGFLLR